MSYTRVAVVSDTPEWEAERRLSVGASEVAAILGLSPWNTALDIWKAKKGIDKPFDPVLSMIGHRSEAIMHEWLDKHSGLDLGVIADGFMARSDDRPWLHASFDRVAMREITNGLVPEFPIQMKTASAFVGHEWNEGIPTAIRIQVQAEMAVFDAPRALVVVWIGGREFKVYWEPRDDRFIDNHLLPAVDEFWHNNVLADVPPAPQTLAENAELYHPTEAREVEATESALEAVERRAVLLSDIEAQKAEADALQLAIANYMQDADTLVHQGRKVLTYKTQKGRESLDTAALRRDHPDIIADYTRVGSPFRVMRTAKSKETK